MSEHGVRCRVAACPESLGDGKEWSFYLLNDGIVPIDRVVLKTFGREWGDMGDAVHPNVEVSHVGPGTHVRIWRDNDDELRIWLILSIRVADRETEHLVEFPLLYRTKATLPVVDALGRPGCVTPVGESSGAA